MRLPRRSTLAFVTGLLDREITEAIRGRTSEEYICDLKGYYQDLLQQDAAQGVLENATQRELPLAIDSIPRHDLPGDSGS